MIPVTADISPFVNPQGQIRKGPRPPPRLRWLCHCLYDGIRGRQKADAFHAP